MHRYRPEVDEDIALAALYQRHAPSLLAYLRMHIPSREDARDVLVEVFLAALEGERFRELRQEEQRSWLWRVARNKVADYYRTSQRRQHSSLDEVAESAWHDEEQEPEQSALRSEEHAELRLNIQRLSPIQQQILHLRFVGNLSCAEIAQALDKREGAVRMLLSRTMNRLRSIYEQP